MSQTSTQLSIARKAALKAAAVYTVFSTLWILFSDRIVLAMVHHPTALTWVQTIKGWLFISVTACIIYALLYREIAAAKESESRLLESEERFRRLIDLSPIGLALYTTDGSFITVNPAYAAIIGYDIDECLTLSNRDITPEEYAEKEKHQLEQLEATGSHGPYEKEYRHRAGHLVPVRLNSMLMQHDGTEYIWSSVEDVTILKKNEQERHDLTDRLKQTQKMEAIGNLAGGVAHDFNNMLSGIMGATELLEQKMPPEPGLKKLLAMIIESTERAAGLTEKLLAFARKQRPASTPVDIHEIIRDAVALLDKSLDKRIRITVEEGAEQSKIVGDPSQLQNVIMNLGINASHAMQGEGKLFISTAVTRLDEQYCRTSPFDLHPGRYLKMEVRDTGCGIAPENLPRIFEPFYTTKEQQKGTGLGLATVFGTVQQHHGEISVESKTGEGSVFHLLFPLTTESTQAGEPVSEPEPGSGTILIVDDEAIMRITLQSLLEELGYSVLQAKNGREALEVYRDNWREIDLVILDMIMPELNGKDCFTELIKINPHVVVILSSGLATEEDIAQMKDEGLFGFLGKPYRIAELSRDAAKAVSQAKSVQAA